MVLLDRDVRWGYLVGVLLAGRSLLGEGVACVYGVWERRLGAGEVIVFGDANTDWGQQLKA